MQRLDVSGAVRLIYKSLGAKGLSNCHIGMNHFKKVLCLRATNIWSHVPHKLMCALIIKKFPPVLWHSNVHYLILRSHDWSLSCARSKALRRFLTTYLHIYAMNCHMLCLHYSVSHQTYACTPDFAISSI